MSEHVTTNGNGSARWTRVQVGASIAFSVLFLMGAFFTFGSSLLGRVSTLETEVIQLSSSQSSSGTRQDAQISSLQNIQNRTGDRIIEMREQITRQAAALIEIETQFCGADHLRNLTHATDMRITSMLWEKEFPGSRFPTDNAYYPQVCNRKTEAAR